MASFNIFYGIIKKCSTCSNIVICRFSWSFAYYFSIYW